ncbi:MAG: hypothetical protein LBE86_13715 [Gemmobacter sp.]|nr:hypothetical protein [Gemmobacter sp.]
MWVEFNYEGTVAMTKNLSHPSDICEAILHEGRTNNAENQILPSENAVADHLLARRLEMTEAYAELVKKLEQIPCALKVFLDLLLSTAAFWGPERNSQARTKREQLGTVNKKNAEKAADLTRLLEKRETLSNSSGFYSSTHYHPLDLIKEAAQENHLYKSYVEKPLKLLREQYGLKYWPALADCLRVLSRDADAADVKATGPLTEAATEASRGSRADFVKALFVAIEENRQRNHGFLPDDFRLTDRTLASLINCALDLGCDEGVDADYVKRLRQRERERANAACG